MGRKTESLAYPTNPLAAIRELQDLDAPESGGHEAEANAESSATTPPVAQTGSSEVTNAAGSERRVGVAPRRRQRLANATSGAGAADARPDPVREAVLGMLSSPYSGEVGQGPFTTTTVKIPTEVWERLGWVASLTGQAKQEIIAEALKEYLVKVSKDR